MIIGHLITRCIKLFRIKFNVENDKLQNRVSRVCNAYQIKITNLKLKMLYLRRKKENFERKKTICLISET